MSTARRGGVDNLLLISGGAGDPQVLAGTVDPSAGGGVAAAEGSLFLRFGAGAGQFFLKTGAANTAWTIQGSTAVLTFGADSIAAGADTRFLPPGFIDGTAPTSSSEAQFASPRAGTMRNLRVRHNTSNGNGNSVVYALRVNGVASALTATLATGAIGNASDLVNAVAVAAGDLIDVTAVKALSIGAGNQDSIVAVEFA